MARSRKRNGGADGADGFYEPPDWECKPLTDYINRIGATQVSMLRWQIQQKTRQNYYIEKAYITIDREGNITAPELYEPTDKEAAEILKSWDGSKLPHIVTARNTEGIKLQTIGSVLFEFRNDAGEITFVQERCEPKRYIPWTLWSDGRWRMHHPEDKYPFWRPFPRRPTGKIMIHEGAKAAKAAHETPKDHPWYEKLSEYEHMGIIGGALAVHRADYAMLRVEGFWDVVYVCDNDHAGMSALQQISRHYGQHLTGIKFDATFPPSFDLADQMPKEMFEGKLYVGKSLDEFMVPATFATEVFYPPAGKDGKKPKPYNICRQHFLEGIAHVVKPESYFFRDYPNQMYSADQFDHVIRPFSDVDGTVRLISRDNASVALGLVYDPSQPGGMINTDNGNYFNTHVPTRVKSYRANERPFLDFMEQLIPDPKERHELNRWCATLIARPDIKMNYGVLLVSETQGVGKSTLMEKILRPLVGISNFSCPGEAAITSDFNDWAAFKRLIGVHEIYAGHSARAYDSLKSIITEKNIAVNIKYMVAFEIENWAAILACSNSMRALKLPMDDRRWLVPKVTQDKRPRSYWAEFFFWLQRQNGLGIIKAWAEDFGDYVLAGAEAPMTAAKKEVVIETYSPGQALMHDVLVALREFREENGMRIIFPETALLILVQNVIHQGRPSDRLEKPRTARMVAKAAGWYINPIRAKVKEWPATYMSKPYLICSHEDDANKSPGQLVEEGYQLFNISEFFQKFGQMH